MDWQMLGNIGEFVGAIGVIASLLYLARQIRQARVTANAQYFRDSTAAYRQITLLISSNEEVARIWRVGCDDLGALDELELQRFTFLFGEMLLHYTDLFNAWEKGLLDEVHFRKWEDYLAMIVNQPGAAAQWEGVLQHGWHPDVRNSLNRARSKVSDWRTVFLRPVAPGEIPKALSD
jgi:hypothetical protein